MKKNKVSRLMKMMKTNKSLLILSLFILWFTHNLFSASLPFDIEGDYLIRLPGSSRAVHNDKKVFPNNAIYSVPNEEKASDTLLLLEGHRIKLYPGSSFKFSKGLLIPLVGRFEFSSSDSEANSINIAANNCNAAYTYGHFLIEATPDNGVFFAMKSKGSAWVKDISRKVYDLRQGQQIHVPLFGNSVLKSHVESFWGKKPSSFGHLGEVGQETAYGIAGTGSGYSHKSSISSDSSEIEEDKEDENDETDEGEITEKEENVENAENADKKEVSSTEAQDLKEE